MGICVGMVGMSEESGGGLLKRYRGKNVMYNICIGLDRDMEREVDMVER